MRKTFKRAVVFAPVALIGIVTACTTAARDDVGRQSATLTASTDRMHHGVYWTRGARQIPIGTPPATKDCANPNLQYGVSQGDGKLVISNVEIVQVAWGATDPKIVALFEDWYPKVVTSPHVSWLSEYDTTGIPGGSGQHVGLGSYKKNPANAGGSWPITPSVSGTTIDDSQIAPEIFAQIKAGSLPAPTKDANGNNNTIYMIDFPPGVTITAFGSQSCASNGFCGYHNTAVDAASGTRIYYGVYPDMSAGSGCEPQGNPQQWVCGGSFDELTNSQVVHGHELVEAITDAEPDGAWYDTNCGEIGDICANEYGACGDGTCQSPSVGSLTIAGATYYMQTEWSNAQKDCVVQGKAVACAGNGDCASTPGTPICDTGTKTCRACVANDCTGSTPACETTGSLAGQCVQCTGANAAACMGATAICDSSTDKCRGCVASDCTGTSKPVCEITGAKQGTCVQCDGNDRSACTGATKICDTTSFTCVGCASNADCSGGTPICDTGTKTCRACTGNTDCTGGKVCDTGSGASAGQCVGCVSNGDCSNPTPTCNTTTNTCAGCKSNGDCPNGQTCDTGSGSCMGGTTGGDGGTTGGDGGTTGGDGGTTGSDGGTTGHDAGTTGHDGGSSSGGDAGSSGNGNGNGDNGGTTTTTATCSVSTPGSSSGAAGGFAGLLLGLGFIARKRSKK